MEDVVLRDGLVALETVGIVGEDGESLASLYSRTSLTSIASRTSIFCGEGEGVGVAEGGEDDEEGKDGDEAPQFAVGEEPADREKHVEQHQPLEADAQYRGKEGEGVENDAPRTVRRDEHAQRRQP